MLWVRADGCGGGRFDCVEAENGCDAAGAEAGEFAQDLLEFARVGGRDVEEEVVLARDGVGAQDLRQGRELTSEPWVVGVGVLLERREDDAIDFVEWGRHVIASGTRLDRSMLRQRAALRTLTP